jgi:hypothetical protein
MIDARTTYVLTHHLIRSKSGKSYGNDLEFYQTACRANGSRHSRPPYDQNTQPYRKSLAVSTNRFPRLPIPISISQSISGSSAPMIFVLQPWQLFFLILDEHIASDEHSCQDPRESQFPFRTLIMVNVSHSESSPGRVVVNLVMSEPIDPNDSPFVCARAGTVCSFFRGGAGRREWLHESTIVI